MLRSRLDPTDCPGKSLPAGTMVAVLFFALGCGSGAASSSDAGGRDVAAGELGDHSGADAGDALEGCDALLHRPGAPSDFVIVRPCPLGASTPVGAGCSACGPVCACELLNSQDPATPQNLGVCTPVTCQ